MIITENAVKEVLHVMETQNIDIKTNFLRVSIKGVNCSGVNYGMSFTNEVNVDDVKIESLGLNVVIDPKSSVLLEDTTLDFHDGLDARGFTFKDPTASSSNGCGSGGCGCKCK